MQRVPKTRPSRGRQEKEPAKMGLQNLLGRQQNEKSWKSCNSRLKSVASICLWKNEMPRKSPKTASKALQAPDQGVDTSTEGKALQKPKMGRPSKYTPEIAQQMCQLLADGIPLREICRREGFPAWQTVYDWMARDDIAVASGGGAGLSVAIAKAREVGQDAIAEQIWLDMLQEPERILSEGGGRVDSGYVQWQKAKAEIGLKLLAKWNPKRYGDRMAIAGDAESPLKIEADLTVFDALITNIETKRQHG